MSTTTISGVGKADGRAVLRASDGSVVPLLVDRWTAVPTAAEMTVLDHAIGPVLDVGCGPGRHVDELAARGLPALGIDISAPAVAFARRRGSIVLHRSVFERLPNEGRWRTALLMDGNIGIGGDATSLLARLHRVLSARGTILTEVEPPGHPSTVQTVRVERDGEAGSWFPWARVSLDDIDDIARLAGLERNWTYTEEGRWFVQLSA